MQPEVIALSWPEGAPSARVDLPSSFLAAIRPGETTLALRAEIASSTIAEGITLFGESLMAAFFREFGPDWSLNVCRELTPESTFFLPDETTASAVRTAEFAAQSRSITSPLEFVEVVSSLVGKGLEYEICFASLCFSEIDGDLVVIRGTKTDLARAIGAMDTAARTSGADSLVVGPGIPSNWAGGGI